MSELGRKILLEGKHPVDALKELGYVMTPEQESQMRILCDEAAAAIDREFLDGPGFPLLRLP